MKHLKKYLSAILVSGLISCSPQPALAQETFSKEPVWVFVSQRHENKRLDVNLGELWYPSKEICESIGPTTMLEGFKGKCYMMKSILTLIENEEEEDDSSNDNSSTNNSNTRDRSTYSDT